jgi:DNA-binding response OmpR family regulator
MWQVVYYEDDLIEHEVIKQFFAKHHPNSDLRLYKTTYEFSKNMENIDAQACVLLLDINLRPYGGDYVAEQMREKHPNLVILAITGDTDTESLNVWQEIGFNGVICKPIDWEAFMILLDEIFNGNIPNEWIKLPAVV